MTRKEKKKEIQRKTGMPDIRIHRASETADECDKVTGGKEDTFKVKIKSIETQNTSIALKTKERKEKQEGRVSNGTLLFSWRRALRSFCILPFYSFIPYFLLFLYPALFFC